MTIGERIKEKRIEKNMTLDDLAKVTNVARQTIYKYENKLITNIPTDKIEIIAKSLGVSPAYLMGWEDSPNIFGKLPEWCSLLNLSENELHDSSIELIDIVKERFPNDIDVLKLCSNLSVYIRDTDNLMINYASNNKSESSIFSTFPKVINLYYELNKEGQELATNYLEMLYKNEKYVRTKEETEGAHDDIRKKFLFRFNNLEDEKE